MVLVNTQRREMLNIYSQEDWGVFWLDLCNKGPNINGQCNLGTSAEDWDKWQSILEDMLILEKAGVLVLIKKK